MIKFAPKGRPGAKTMYCVLILLGMTGLYSCETLVNTIPESKLPKVESQLTLFAFISPQDSVIQVRIGQTRPIFSESPAGFTPVMVVINGDTIYTRSEGLTDAIVTISDGTTQATLPYRALDLTYALPTSKFPIRAGGTYTLTVTDGQRTAQATCTIPATSVPITSYSLDTTVTSSFGLRDTSLNLTYNWKDPAGQENYYRVRAFELYEYSVVTVNPDELFLVEKRRQHWFYFSWSRNSGRSIFQSDANLDGAEFSSPPGDKRVENELVFQQLIRNPVKPEKGPALLGVYLQLLHTDKNYFLYHRSLEQTNGDNPFTEPALVYTNVRGGLGVFAGYNQYTKIITP
jgi:hypothetical protein